MIARNQSGVTVVFLVLVAVASAVWWLLGRMDDRVTWLSVDAPGHAVAGEMLPVRVRVKGLAEASRLAVDLHGSGVRDGSNEFLAPGGAKPVGKEGGRFDFEIMVRPRADLNFVNAILFLSPSGDWKDQTFVATTGLIPVTERHVGDGTAMVRLDLHPLVGSGRQEDAGGQVFPRLAAGCLLAAGSVLVLVGLKSLWNGWLVLAVAFAMAGAWELLGLESRLGAAARAWARAGDVYYSRELFQKAVVSLTLASVLVFAGLVWRKRDSYQPALLFFGLYFGISVVNLLSLHSLDFYARRSWHGISLVDAVKLACAAATFLCVLRVRRGLK